ncbi:RIP metalloprotease RseP [Vreelandella utahensis]|uniref:RIP metalloprotease RseP n=1 Tax=Vreelandella halophila TaxID=86177 RepID=UPI0009874F97|nr:RIP metalloprotease RseP [Halomonas utahensis]
MSVIQTVLALIVTLGILVTVHEFGHFWVARRLGIRVLRFSVGFGKPLFMRRDRHGTEFAVAAIPLGGYVKMLDEREGEVPEEEKHLAFNRQTPPRRIAVAAAGPIANFIFAVFAYWLLAVIGFTTIAPVVGDVEPETPAERMELESGMEVLEVDGRQTPSWRHVGMALLQRAGEQGQVSLTLEQEGRRLERSTALDGWLGGARDPDPVREFGIEPWRPDIPPVLGEIRPGSPAEEAGLQPGDRILAVEDEPVPDWFALVERIQAAPGEALSMRIERDGSERTITVTPARKTDGEGRRIGRIGAGVQSVSWPEEMQRQTQLGPVQAVPEAFNQFWNDTRTTLVAVGKMASGLLSVRNISGPITIARVAETTVTSGFESFVRFLAYLSISLGIINLLPIPILDGGHILFYAWEWGRGRPVSEAVQGVWLRLGLFLIAMLTVLALYNDVLRL